MPAVFSQAAFLGEQHAQSVVQKKRENAIMRNVMARIGEKSSSARSLFLMLDADHDGRLSHLVRSSMGSRD